MYMWLGIMLLVLTELSVYALLLGHHVNEGGQLHKPLCDMLANRLPGAKQQASTSSPSDMLLSSSARDIDEFKAPYAQPVL